MLDKFISFSREDKRTYCKFDQGRLLCMRPKGKVGVTVSSCIFASQISTVLRRVCVVSSSGGVSFLSQTIRRRWSVTVGSGFGRSGVLPLQTTWSVRSSSTRLSGTSFVCRSCRGLNFESRN